MIAFVLDAAFIFFNFLLSIAATVFATKAIEEIKVKQREEYNRLSVHCNMRLINDKQIDGKE